MLQKWVSKRFFVNFLLKTNERSGDNGSNSAKMGPNEFS